MKKIVELEHAALYTGIIERMKSEPDFNSIIDDLVAFTGLSEEQVIKRVLRDPETHFKSEFRWHSPQDERELLWFYRCSYGYLFANASHPYWHKLDFVTPRDYVLDFGAGIGNNVLTLSKCGIRVDYLEVNMLENAFINFRIQRHAPTRFARPILPSTKGEINPIKCIRHEYSIIILQDVLEHIPQYHTLLGYLIERLQVGGRIVESSPFNPQAKEIDIHLKPIIPLEKAMKGMKQIEKGIWRKEKINAKD